MKNRYMCTLMDEREAVRRELEVKSNTNDMIKIQAITFKYLRGEAHYQFLCLFDQLLGEFPAVKQIVAELYAKTFAGLLAQEVQIVDRPRASYYTRRIAEADRSNDRLLIGIRKIVSASLYHFDPEIVDAAQKISTQLKVFGYIPSKSYEEEAAAIKLLIQDMQTPQFAPKVAALNLTPWIARLSESLDNFERLMDLRSDEEAGKLKLRLIDVRRQIDACYHQMVLRINSAAVLDTADTCREFILRLNEFVRYFNGHSRRPVARKIRATVVNSIPSQPYTGSAVTPIPTVTFNGAPLVFAKDFTLAYRHNVRPGNASVIIAGKGDYKGRKVVTFNIEENSS